MKICLSLVILMLAVPLTAQHKYFEMYPPKAKAIQKKRVTRMSDSRDYKMKGYIGENDEGLLSIRDISVASPDDKKKITKLVEDENADRKNYYKEVIAFNKMTPQEQKFLIKSTFETLRNTDAKGTYFYENKKWEKHH